MSETDLITLLGAAEMTRRQALAWLASGLAAASAGCIKAPGDPILPYNDPPRGIVPGVAQHYATAMVLDGYATGLLGTTRDGRPIKLDGNPSHPASLGASSALHQASLLDLYDPHRAKNVLQNRRPASLERLRPLLAAQRTGPLWIVLPPQSSATVGALLDSIRARHREVHVVFAHAQPPHDYAGTSAAYGRPLEQQLDLTRADVLVCLDADLLTTGPMALRYARQFATRRAPDDHAAQMNRLYVAEPMLTPSGSMADERLAARAEQILPLLCALALALRNAGRSIATLDWGAVEALASRLGDDARSWTRRAAADLLARPRASVIVAGTRRPPAAHALAHLLNDALGNVGSTVHFNEAVRLEPESSTSLRDLLSALRAHAVDSVMFLETNPVYSSGDGEEMARLLQHVPFTLHYSLHDNETSQRCAWLLPACQYLESWDDARASDGTRSIVQPLVRPLNGSMSLLELLALLAGDSAPRASALPLVKAHRAGAFTSAGDAERAFERTLQLGAAEGSALPRLTPALKLSPDISEQLTRALSSAAAPGLELALGLSRTVHDGRFANNGWLQELPHPVT
jgi:molybdopterin-containing oxidoreductase family iron-sulfur binding subunit